jgi:hypothetical protein
LPGNLIGIMPHGSNASGLCRRGSRARNSLSEPKSSIHAPALPLDGGARIERSFWST